MYINNFRHSLILIGLTFALPLGILTYPALAQTSDLQNTVVTPVGVTVYNFPKQEITYSTDGSFDYKGQHFQGDQITVVDSAIGKQVSVVLDFGVDTSTTFTLLLPNGLIQNDGKIKAVGITTHNVDAGIIRTNSYTILNGTVGTASNGN